MNAVGALLIAIAPRYPVARTEEGTVVGPAVGVWPLLAVLAVAPAVFAVMLLLVRQRGPALAMVGSLGAIALGSAVFDVQLVQDVVRAARPELVAPAGLSELRPAMGAWILLAGHAVVACGGAVAAYVVGMLRGEQSLGETMPGSDTPPGALLLGLGCVVPAAFGLLAAPFVSIDPYLVPRSVLDAPGWASAGGFVLAAGAVLAVVLACSSPDPRVAIGGLVGVAVGLLSVAVPRVVVAALVDTQRVAPGPVLTVAGAFGLAMLAIWVGGRERRAVKPARPAHQSPAGVLAARWRRSAGWFGVIAGGCAMAAAVLDPLRLAAGSPEVELPTLRLLLAVGMVLLALGAATVTDSAGPSVRPVLAVVLVAVPMAAAEPLADVLAVLGVNGTGPGPGFWMAVSALLAALLAALAAVLAGCFERDEVDLSESRCDPVDTSLAWAAAVLAVPAFWLPLLNGAGWGITGVLGSPFGLATWGLLAGFAACVAALLLAPRCRRQRAVAVYAGVALVLALRLVRLVPSLGPIVVGPGGARVGEGTWASALCLLLVLAALATVPRALCWRALSSESGALVSGLVRRWIRDRADSGSRGQARPGRA